MREELQALAEAIVTYRLHEEKDFRPVAIALLEAEAVLFPITLTESNRRLSEKVTHLDTRRQK
jgi:hypothetical protein